jgi:hypothetical protein
MNEICKQCGKPAHYGGCFMPFDKPKPEEPSSPEEIAIAQEATARHTSPVTVRREMAERKLAAASPDQRVIFYREKSPIVEACQWQGASDDLVPKAPWPPGWDVSIARVVGSLTEPGEFDLVFGTTTVQPGDWVVLLEDGAFIGVPAALFHARFQPAAAFEAMCLAFAKLQQEHEALAEEVRRGGK